jgi:hypothetical protein
MWVRCPTQHRLTYTVCPSQAHNRIRIPQPYITYIRYIRLRIRQNVRILHERNSAEIADAMRKK